MGHTLLMRDSSSRPDEPALSLIVPAFNEAGCIGDTITRLQHYLESVGLSWEVIVVDDGSEDGTPETVAGYAEKDERVRLVRGAHRGKGAAVRRGMVAARGGWRFLADADLSMPPDNIGRFFAAVRESADTPHVAIGSREAPGALRVGEPWTRHVIGRVFNLVVQALAVPGIRDTQCGFKLFSAEAAEALFPRQRLDSFAFDVEVLFLAQRAGARVCEVGIEWHCRVDSRVSAARGAKAFADVMRVRWNAWRGRYADLPSLAGRPPRCTVDHAWC